jgi:predicted O-linked N-acetylglucosamine transferase (SPINDLY family)
MIVARRARRFAGIGFLAQADIALDSFFYSGQTTTCECLWMRVPLVNRNCIIRVTAAGFSGGA